MPESIDTEHTPRKQVVALSVQVVPVQQACPRAPHSTPPSSMTPPSPDATHWLWAQAWPGRHAWHAPPPMPVPQVSNAWEAVATHCPWAVQQPAQFDG
jgi:hypothetical protein